MRQVEKKATEWSDWDGASSPSFDSIQRNLGVSAVIEAWGGGTFDSRRDRLIVTGGGHNGYGGNEVYAFELGTLRWTRITDPTPFPVRCGWINDDGTPVSRHTYGGLSYIEATDDLFMSGGAPDCELGGAGAKGTWLLDLRQLEQQAEYAPSVWNLGNGENEPPTNAEDDAVYDPVSGRVFYQYGPSPSGWSSYDSNSDSWTNHSQTGVNPGMTAIIPGIRRFIVQFGAGLVDGYYRWGGLGSSKFELTRVATTGAKEMELASNPGAAYDWQSDRIVAWSGGSNVYALDVDTDTWELHPPADTNLVDPGPQDAIGGTYGRFAYSKSFNVFIVVDSVDENVFLYRLAPGEGSGPTIVPKPPILGEN
jgi:hypothetical protein